MLIRHSEIKLLLPHRHPMLLVDAVVAVAPGSHITAIKNISRNEPCFAAVPANVGDDECPYPASLVIESFCQAAGILQVLSQREAAPAQEQVMLFGSMANVEFHGDAFAGDTLTHEARLETALSDAAVFGGEVHAGGRRIATIERVVVALRPATALGRGEADQAAAVRAPLNVTGGRP